MDDFRRHSASSNRPERNPVSLCARSGGRRAGAAPADPAERERSGRFILRSSASSLRSADDSAKALCLLSGGMDSAVAAAIARGRGYGLHALSIDYGQRHRRELRSARVVARALGARNHAVLRVDLRQIGGSALTGPMSLERRRTAREILDDPRIPNTYVPLRNTVFLALAAARAEVAGADAPVLGANAVDSSHYPDCRPEYYRAVARALALGSKRGAEGRPLRILTPVIGMTKGQIVRKGLALGVPFHLTWSCYAGGASPCGRCDSCLLRAKGFREAGVPDPLLGNPGRKAGGWRARRRHR